MSDVLPSGLAARLAAPRAEYRGGVWNLGEALNWERLKVRWEELQRLAGRLPMTGSAWCGAAGEAGREAYAFTIGGERELLAGATMEIIPIAGVDHLALLSQDLLNEPMDLLYRDEQCLVELLRLLLGERYPLYLGRVDVESKLVAALKDSRLPWHLARVTPAPACPVIRLDAAWREPEACLSSRRRQDYRRAARKAEQMGNVRAEVLSPRVSEVDRLLDLAFAIEAASWKGVEGSALKLDQARGRFFRKFAALAAEEGTLRIALLFIGEDAVAMQLAVETLGRFWLLKIGYDERFAACSPGQILMRESIARAAERELKSFEFLGGIAAWTEAWTKEHRDCVCIRVYPMGMRSATALTATAIAAGIGRVRRMAR